MQLVQNKQYFHDFEFGFSSKSSTDCHLIKISSTCCDPALALIPVVSDEKSALV